MKVSYVAQLAEFFEQFARREAGFGVIRARRQLTHAESRILFLRYAQKYVRMSEAWEADQRQVCETPEALWDNPQALGETVGRARRQCGCLRGKALTAVMESPAHQRSQHQHTEQEESEHRDCKQYEDVPSLLQEEEYRDEDSRYGSREKD